MAPMLRVALRPRFLGLLALMIAATVVCGLLAGWQWQRAHRAIVQDRAAPAAAVPLEDLVSLGDPLTNEASGRSAEVAGTFDPERRLLVPDRQIDGQDAVIVLAPLEVAQADGSTAILVVARGWIPAAQITGKDGALDPSLVPAAPSGEVTLTGHVEAAESASEGVRGATVTEISTPLLANVWGAPMYGAYLAQSSSAEGLHPMPLAESAFSRGLNWQNIGYSFQWVVFGGFFLYLWWRSVRTAWLDERAEGSTVAGGEGPDPGPDADPGADPDAGPEPDPASPIGTPSVGGTEAPSGAKEEGNGAHSTTAR